MAPKAKPSPSLLSPPLPREGTKARRLLEWLAKEGPAHTWEVELWWRSSRIRSGFAPLRGARSSALRVLKKWAVEDEFWWSLPEPESMDFGGLVEPVQEPRLPEVGSLYRHHHQASSPGIPPYKRVTRLERGQNSLKVWSLYYDEDGNHPMGWLAEAWGTLAQHEQEWEGPVDEPWAKAEVNSWTVFAESLGTRPGMGVPCSSGQDPEACSCLQHQVYRKVKLAADGLQDAVKLLRDGSY